MVEIVDPENATILINNHEGAMWPLNHTHNFTLKYIVFIINKGSFIDFGEESELLLIDIVVDDVFYNHVYLNSCNKQKCWTEEKAKELAYTHIRMGLQDSFEAAFQSEEFLEIFAYEELETIITNIMDKIEESRRNDNYKYIQFEYENDIEYLYDTALNEYGVSNGFIDGMRAFINYTYVPSYEKAPWEGWESTIFFTIVQSFIIIIYFGLELSKKLKELKLPSIFGVVAIIFYSIFYEHYLTEILRIFEIITPQKVILFTITILPLVIGFIFYLKFKKNKKLQKKNIKKKKQNKTHNK